MGSRPPFPHGSDGSGQKRLQKVITIINPISPVTVTKSTSSNTQNIESVFYQENYFKTPITINQKNSKKKTTCHFSALPLSNLPFTQIMQQSYVLIELIQKPREKDSLPRRSLVQSDFL